MEKMETTAASTRPAPYRRRILVGCAALALALGGAGWSGCGDDEGEDAADQIDEAVENANEQAEEFSEQAEQEAEEAAQKAEEEIEQAEEELDQAQEDAQQQLEEEGGGGSGDGY
jgi:uncharacterized protein HemX